MAETAVRTISWRWASVDHRSRRAAVAGDAREEVVEGADIAREQSSTLREELALDALDVRSVRHDEHRIALERAQVALEEQCHFAGVRRP